MSGHTKEPWDWSEHQFNAPPFEGTLDHECGIYPPDGEIGPVAIASGKNDARRIVACVNACAGIPTGMLEAAGQSAVIALRPVDELVAERNALLAALKVIAWNADMYLPATIRQVATEAIAQVKL